MHNILAIDTAYNACSVAIIKDVLHVYRREDRPRMQASQLMPMVEDAMREAQLTYSALDSIGITVGPGSFTGLRIGLATANAIGFAANKPVIGIHTLTAMAYAARASAQDSCTHITVLLGAGKGEISLQHFHRNLTPLNDAILVSPETLTAEDIAPHTHLAGIGDENILSALPEPIRQRLTPITPDARAVAALLHREDASHHLPSEPLYVRPPDAKLPAT